MAEHNQDIPAFNNDIKHPLHSEGLGAAFKYCPRCGSPRFVENDWKSCRCEDCGFVYYLNPSAATAAFILDSNDRLLVVHRKLEPEKGKMDLPGGFCDMGESMEQGVAREVKEETGLTVVSSEFLFSFPNNYMYSGFNVPTMDSFFLCRVDDISTLHTSDDATNAEWLALDTVNPDEFAFNSTRNAVSKFLTNKSKYLKK